MSNDDNDDTTTATVNTAIATIAAHFLDESDELLQIRRHIHTSSDVRGAPTWLVHRYTDTLLVHIHIGGAALQALNKARAASALRLRVDGRRSAIRQRQVRMTVDYGRSFGVRRVHSVDTENLMDSIVAATAVPVSADITVRLRKRGTVELTLADTSVAYTHGEMREAVDRIMELAVY